MGSFGQIRKKIVFPLLSADSRYFRIYALNWKIYCVVYKFKCDLCDASCLGYTRRNLSQRIGGHKQSAIGKHLRVAHNQRNKDLQEQFTVLKKCREKFERLIYEMLSTQEKKPKLNIQSDSMKAKLFSTKLSLSTFHIVVLLITSNEIFRHIL